MYQWVNGSIPSDIKRLSKIARMGQKRFQNRWQIISKKFQKKNESELVNPRMEKTREEQDNYRKSQSEAGKRGVKKKRELGLYPFNDPSSDPSNNPPSEKQALQSSSLLLSLSKDKQDPSCHFSLKMNEHFENTLAYCKKIEKMVNQFHHVGKTFNPYQWVQEKVNKDFHPGAIAETLCSMEDGHIFNSIKVPYAYANKILATKNGNWNEKDAIAKHEDVKAEFSAFVEKSDLTELIRRIG